MYLQNQKNVTYNCRASEATSIYVCNIHCTQIKDDYFILENDRYFIPMSLYLWNPQEIPISILCSVLTYAIKCNAYIKQQYVNI